MHPYRALRDGFSLWLKEQDKFRPHSRMDPYATSLRNTKTMVPWLTEIRESGNLDSGSTRRTDQALVDMRAIHLIKRDQVTLTELGSTVLEKWQHYSFDIDTENSQNEIGRASVLVFEALRSSDSDARNYYEQYYRRWCNLIRYTPTAERPSDYWFADLVRLLLPSYLDHEDSRGFNPFLALVTVNRGHIGETSQWQEWADNPEWEESDDVSRLLKSIIDNNRRGGAKTFRQGLEINRIANNRPAELPELLDDWGIPK